MVYWWFRLLVFECWKQNVKSWQIITKKWGNITENSKENKIYAIVRKPEQQRGMLKYLWQLNIQLKQIGDYQVTKTQVEEENDSVVK